MRRILFGGLIAAVVVGSFVGLANSRLDAIIVGPGPHGVVEMATVVGPGPMFVTMRG